MTHHTRDDLRRWREHGDPADRERVVGHLAVCDECGALFGEVLDERPLEIVATHAAPAEIRAAGYAAYRTSASTTGRVIPWRTPWATALGLAATIALAVLISPMLRPETPLVPPREPTVRGLTIRTISPAGTVATPFSFQWSTAADAAAYEILVRDARGALVWSARITTTPADALRDLQERLIPGQEYSWQVTAFDTRGIRITQSAPQAFVVAPRAP